MTPRVISRKTKDLSSDYKWGFVTEIATDLAPKGLNEDTIRLISAKKGEPDWMLQWRLKAYRYWMTLDYAEPKWAKISHPPVDFQDMYYYSSPLKEKRP